MVNAQESSDTDTGKQISRARLPRSKRQLPTHFPRLLIGACHISSLYAPKPSTGDSERSCHFNPRIDEFVSIWSWIVVLFVALSMGTKIRLHISENPLTTIPEHAYGIVL